MSSIFTRLFEYACPASNVVAAISHKSFVWLHCKSTIIFKNCYLVPPALFNQCWQRLTRPTHEEILRKIQIHSRDRQQIFLRSCEPSPVCALFRCRLCKTNVVSAFEIVITKVDASWVERALPGHRCEGFKYVSSNNVFVQTINHKRCHFILQIQPRSGH